MPDRLRPLLLAGVVVLALGGCGGGEPAAPPSPSAPSGAPSSAVPSSVTPTPTSLPSPSSAEPSPRSASPTPTRTPRPTASPAPTADGVYANGLSVSEDGALSYVPLRWYTGENAEARCAEKDVNAEGAWCVDYYYEEAGERKSAALTDSTEVRLLNDDLKPTDASLTDLITAIEDELWPNFQIATAGDRVTRITQVFTP